MDINEETLAFYYQLGRSITAWAHVEFALGSIVTLSFSTKDRTFAARGFSSIDNFRAKLQYANTIVRSQNLKKTEIANWVTLYDRAQKLAKKRNYLAHYWVLTSPNIKTPGRRVMLMPFRYVEAGKSQRYAGAIRLRDIAGYQLEFSALSAALENFQCRIAGHKERFPKSLEQPKNPPPIAQILREIHAYVPPQPEPSEA